MPKYIARVLHNSFGEHLLQVVFDAETVEIVEGDRFVTLVTEVSLEDEFNDE